MQLLDHRGGGGVVGLGDEHVHFIALERAGRPHPRRHRAVAACLRGDEQRQGVEQVGAHRLDVLHHRGQRGELARDLLERLRHRDPRGLAVEGADGVAQFLFQAGDRAQGLFELLFQLLDRLPRRFPVRFGPGVEIGRRHHLALAHRGEAEAHRRAQDGDVA